MSEEQSTDESREGESAVSRAYDAWSERYDRDQNATRDLDASALQRASLAFRGSEIVEVGCGTGKNTAFLADEAASVLAMDFSLGMLAKARERVRARNVRFLAHDLRDRWPLADTSADIVTCDLVLEHIDDVAPVFAEAARVLRAGGRLYISELHPFRQHLGGRANFEDRVTGETVFVPAHLHSVSEFVNAGIAAGLCVREVRELTEEGAREDAPPRLLTIVFARS